MKKFLTTAIILAMFTTCTTLMAQPQQDEYLGLPGDNLNLYAVMKLFQESETLEGFERNLNNENTRINNLDLNGDNFIDYIRVVDYVDRDVHNIVLQVAVNRKETQDVAVFTVQRFSSGQVQIQLIGDEALYGRNYIIEPIFDEQFANQTANPGYTGRYSGNVTVVRTTYYEVAAWPVIRFIYLPTYVAWHSAWYWGYYPSYWHPWTPYYWHFYYGYHYNHYNHYYSHYHHCNHIRYNHWNDFYYSSRHSHSPYVSHRIESGHYKSTYSHPDQRKHGEALFARTNPDQSSRRAAQYSGNGTSRRTDYQANQTRQKEGSSFSTSRRTNATETRSASNQPLANNSGSARRSGTTINDRYTVNPVKEQINSSARRSASSMSNRSTAAPSKEQSTSSAKRPAATATNRSTVSQAKEYNTFSAKRATNPGRSMSASTTVNRSVSNSKPEQRASNNRSTGKPATTGENFSSRRSSEQSQSVKSSKINEKKRSDESLKTAHRR